MTAYSDRERHLDYMAFVKTLPCELRGVRGAGPCTGVVEADHAGVLAAADVPPSADLGPVDGRGTSYKPDDRTCIPLCTGHHRDRHDSRGYFDPDGPCGMTKAKVRDFRLSAIARTQTRWRTFQLNMSSGWF